MDEKRKRVTAPRIAAALSALLAGAALYTVSGSERQGIQVKEYTEAAEAADSTIMVYMNGSELWSSHSGPQGHDGCPEDGGTGGKFSLSSCGG